MKTLALDWGNSALKYGIFSGSDLLVQGRMPNITLADMQPWVHSLEVQNIVAASTGGPEPGSLLAILKGEFNVLIVQADTPGTRFPGIQNAPYAWCRSKGCCRGGCKAMA